MLFCVTNRNQACLHKDKDIANNTVYVRVFLKLVKAHDFVWQNDRCVLGDKDILKTRQQLTFSLKKKCITTSVYW